MKSQWAVSADIYILPVYRDMVLHLKSKEYSQEYHRYGFTSPMH